jgi:hypothetical protein
MTKHFRFSIPADRRTTQLLNGGAVTKAQLQDLACELPIKKATVQYINDQMHQNQLPNQDVGLALALVAIQALMTEKAGKRLVEAGEELVIDELRTTMIESFVPFLESSFEEGIPHFLTAITATLGSIFGVLIAHVPLLDAVSHTLAGLAPFFSASPSWLIATGGYLTFLGARHLWHARSRTTA